MNNMVVLVYPYRVHDGMLDVDLGSGSRAVADRLRRAIIRYVADETPSSMAAICRVARMCFELERDQALADLTVEDVNLLYSLQLAQDTERLFATLNVCRPKVTTSAMDPAAAHSAAMSVIATMAS